MKFTPEFPPGPAVPLHRLVSHSLAAHLQNPFHTQSTSSARAARCDVPVLHLLPKRAPAPMYHPDTSNSRNARDTQAPPARAAAAAALVVFQSSSVVLPCHHASSVHAHPKRNIAFQSQFRQTRFKRLAKVRLTPSSGVRCSGLNQFSPAYEPLKPYSHRRTSRDQPHMRLSGSIPTLAHQSHSSSPRIPFQLIYWFHVSLPAASSKQTECRPGPPIV